MLNITQDELNVLSRYNFKVKKLDCPSCHSRGKAWLKRSSKGYLYWNCNKQNKCGRSGKVLDDYYFHYKSEIKYNPIPEDKDNIEILKLIPELYKDLSNYLETKPSLRKEYSDYYNNLRGLMLPTESLPVDKEFISKYKYKYKALGLDKYLGYQLNFHFSFDGKAIYFTPYLPEEKFLEYQTELLKHPSHIYSERKEYSDFKRLYPSKIKTQVSGSQSLNTDNVKRKILWITESFDKAQALIQLGYSAIGLGGINQLTALRQFLKDNSEIIREKKLKVMISFDTRLSLIDTAEDKASYKIVDVFKDHQINNVYISKLPFELSNLQQDEKGKISQDIDDYLKSPSEKIKIQKVANLIKFSYKHKKVKENIPTPKQTKVYKKTSKDDIDFITREQAQLNLALETRSLKPNNHIIALFQPGTGKSYSFIKYILENRDKRILFVSAQKKLINQIEIGLSEKMIRYHWIKSYADNCKQNHDEKKADNYDYYNKLLELMDKDQKAENLCKQCPLRKNCLALREKYKPESEYQKSNVYLITFDKFKYQINEIIRKVKPDIIFFDEGTEAGAVKKIEIGFNDYSYLKKRIDINSNSSKSKAFRILDLLFDKIKIHQIDLKEKALFKQLKRLIPDLEKFLKEINLKDLKITDDLTDFLEVSPHLLTMPSLIESLNNKCKGMAIRYGKITMFKPLEIDLSNINLPVVWLNATARPKLIQKVFNIDPENIKILNPDIETKNIEIYQNTSRLWSKSSLIDDNRQAFKQLMSVIDHEKENSRLLVITPLEVETKLKKVYEENENLKFEHHYNLRGVNTYKDFDKVIITETCINQDSFETESKVLFNLSDADFKTKTFFKKSSIKVNDDSYLSIQATEYKNELVRDYYKTKSTDEMYQNYHRIIRTNLPDSKKKVIIFSQSVMEGIKTDVLNYELPSCKNDTNTIKKSESYNLMESILTKYFSENLYLDSENRQYLQDYFLKNFTSTEVKNEILKQPESLYSSRSGSTLNIILYYIDPITVTQKTTISEKTFRKYFNSILESLRVNSYHNGFGNYLYCKPEHYESVKENFKQSHDYNIFTNEPEIIENFKLGSKNINHGDSIDRTRQNEQKNNDIQKTTKQGKTLLEILKSLESVLDKTINLTEKVENLEPEIIDSFPEVEPVQSYDYETLKPDNFYHENITTGLNYDDMELALESILESSLVTDHHYSKHLDLVSWKLEDSLYNEPDSLNIGLDNIFTKIYSTYRNLFNDSNKILFLKSKKAQKLFKDDYIPAINFLFFRSEILRLSDSINYDDIRTKEGTYYDFRSYWSKYFSSKYGIDYVLSEELIQSLLVDIYNFSSG